MTSNKLLITKTLYLEDNQHVGDLPGFLFPAGIIEKRHTGIGATQAEIESTRNSIIVFPSRSIAYNKSLRHVDTFYVGSLPKKKSVKVDSIITYYKNESIKHKKYLVVANSLPKIFEALGERVIYSQFFFMFDEIDKFQGESTFRVELENCLDYFLHKDCKGCLVSATMGEFSNMEFSDLPRIVIEKKYPNKQHINLYKIQSRGNLINFVYHKIKSVPGDKILIAHKSLDTIKEIIKGLDAKSRIDTKILCAEGSGDNVGNYFGRLENDNLPGRINFMTSAYFSGVDIEEDFHLVIISDESTDFSLLSISEMRQIVGRCRTQLKSVDIIIPEKQLNIPLEKKSNLVELANTLLSSAKPHSIRLLQMDLDGESILINKKAHSQFTYKGVQLLRIDKNKDLNISTFTIDQYWNRNKELRSLYSLRRTPVKSLSEHFTVSLANIDLKSMDFWLDKLSSFLDVVNKDSSLAIDNFAVSSNELKILSRIRLCQQLIDHDDITWIIDNKFWQSLPFRKEYLRRIMRNFPTYSDIWQYMEKAFNKDLFYTRNDVKLIIATGLPYLTIRFINFSVKDYIPILNGFYETIPTTCSGNNGYKIVGMHPTHKRVNMMMLDDNNIETLKKDWTNA